MNTALLPQRKVVFGGIAGSASSVAAWILKDVFKIDVPPDIAVAITTVLVFAVQYFVTNKTRN